MPQFTAVVPEIVPCNLEITLLKFFPTTRFVKKPFQEAVGKSFRVVCENIGIA